MIEDLVRGNAFGAGYTSGAICLTKLFASNLRYVNV